MARIAFAASLVLVAFSAVGFAAPFVKEDCKAKEHLPHHHEHHHHEHEHHDHTQHTTPCSLPSGGCHTSPSVEPVHEVPHVPSIPEAHNPKSSEPKMSSHLPKLGDALGLATGGGSLLGFGKSKGEAEHSVGDSGHPEPVIGHKELPTEDDSFPIHGDLDIDDEFDDEDGNDEEE